ncbi:hypothetical protein BGW36DRAFT_428937 [Talaromyces proteolyticus]|uniref:Zn(2)-C6 fungal-type domain-containing protein n=1 Tax=Talaromyces proteolyticus TaxID=1131652 RepID=A0AAD4KSJ2_9EURO|nr:uncharacterized protein BGW36DRAFT_428937 [Talaromyces proteolyticus]KAH8695045.1 hypothetical protein BGW36DRAFT_428937 [Talaromyces proteolyticus]
MADDAATDTPRWRISKACEECRRRKIRCDGAEPCQHCKQRSLECEYRGFVRQRKRKHELVSRDAAAEDNEDDGVADPPRAPSISVPKATATPSARPSVSGTAGRNSVINYSVAATHVASPSCVIQLYYGPTSNFSLMQLMYRQLVEGYNSSSSSSNNDPSREIEEAGPGLDLFSHRRLFFGDLAGNQDMSISDTAGLASSVFFILPSTASKYLERYLSTIYYLMPWQPKEEYRRRLEQLYDKGHNMSLESPEATIMLLFLASGAAMVEDIEQGEFLFKKAKANAANLDELVNLQAIQIPLIMIIRKAIAAGLHKNTQLQVEQTSGDASEKRITFWSLFFYESWICFGLGRPISIPTHEIAIPDPQDQPMLLALVELSRTMAKSARNIYGQRHDSLLPMWKNAKEIRKDLQAFARRVRGVLNFGLEASPKPGEVGVCQTILLLLYHHVTLLTFRPFLIFRARWQKDKPAKNHEDSQTDANDSEQNTPSWLHEACESCLESARCIIRYLSDAYQVNIRVREIKYHGFFLESACFTLAFDMMHTNSRTAEKHLPWVRSGLRCLASMLPKNQFQEQISMTMAAIQQMLIAVFPGLAAGGGPDLMSSDINNQNFDQKPAAAAAAAGAGGGGNEEFYNGSPSNGSSHEYIRTPTSHQQQQYQPRKPQQQQQPFNKYSPNTDITNPSASAFFNSLGQNLLMTTPISGGDTSTDSNTNNNPDELVDFTTADINWENFDFSTMDLEAFLSIDPTVGNDNNGTNHNGGGNVGFPFPIWGGGNEQGQGFGAV